MEKRLHRNEHDKVVAGVASGLAEYMQVDITIVRLLFVLSTLFLAGAGLLVYIVMWIVAPLNNDPMAKFKKFNEHFEKQNATFNGPFNNPQNTEETKWNTPNTDFNTPNDMNNFQKPKSSDTGRTIGGLILLVLGIYFLLRQLDILPYWFSIWKIYKLWPLALVAIGISLIFRNQRKTEWDNFKKTTEEAQKTQTESPVKEEPIITEDKDSATPNP
ncbi:PspC domain-containing protein [Pedobacter polaris]|uniref:PspC domain-containing protein n=1 Tax=Pedobacter polaris TaxID=2571273 RepID=A0A4U1CR79_9SPHI|nr:PspC domain-containing protein [Pedobacter polaris]TKC08121.1 PspC domain-containing protein [Pedobacter polaris]